MRNAYLHYITNRVDDFVSLVLTDGVELPRVDLPKEYAQTVTALGLDNTATDFYVRGCLAILKAFPDITAQLGADNPTFDMEDVVASPVKFEGIKLVTNNNVLPYAKSKAFAEIRLSYFDVGTIKATQGADTYYLPISVGEDRLFVNWNNSPLTIRGDIQTEQAWGSTFSAVITVEPFIFPISDLACAVSKSEYTNRLIRLADTQAEFFASDLPTDKLAIILLSLALVYKKSIQ